MDELDVLDDRELHILLKRNGDDFLGLDVSDHGIAPNKEVRGICRELTIFVRWCQVSVVINSKASAK